MWAWGAGHLAAGNPMKLAPTGLYNRCRAANCFDALVVSCRIAKIASLRSIGEAARLEVSGEATCFRRATKLTLAPPMRYFSEAAE